MITVDDQIASPLAWAIETMVSKVKILLGNNIVDCILDDETIKTCIDLALGRYGRKYHYDISNDWFNSNGISSWVLEYTVANSKLILGEARSKFNFDGKSQVNGDMLMATALERISTLENELNKD